MLEDLSGEYLRACRNTFGSWLGGKGDCETLILGRSTISALMQPKAWLDAAEDAFRAMAEGRAQSPMPMAIEAQDGMFHAKGGTLSLDGNWVALKLNGNFPANRSRFGLPTICGVVLLCDGADGRVLAILDSIEVTLRRTAAATALAARHLARTDSKSVLVCGCGDQAYAQLDAIREVVQLERGYCWDRDGSRAERFAQAAIRGGFPLVAVNDFRGAAAASDIVITCTTATEPFLGKEIIRPGAFIAAVGADSPHKNEIEPELMASSIVVCDVTSQCEAMGDLRHAIAAKRMTRDQVHGQLCELVVGAKAGRESAGPITIFDSTGSAAQDVVAAVRIYQRAIEAGGRRTVDLSR